MFKIQLPARPCRYLVEGSQQEIEKNIKMPKEQIDIYEVEKKESLPEKKSRKNRNPPDVRHPSMPVGWVYDRINQ
jgi:hypothetical protein